MSDIVSPFLTGLEYCAAAFGIVCLAIVAMFILFVFVRWMYGVHPIADSQDSGAIEGAMSREEAKLWSDEAI
jgi:hypothetical protein